MCCDRNFLVIALQMCQSQSVRWYYSSPVFADRTADLHSISHMLSLQNNFSNLTCRLTPLTIRLFSLATVIHCIRVTHTSLIQSKFFRTDWCVNRYSRGRSFKCLFKMGFVTWVRGAAPRPGLQSPISHKEGIFFLHAHWHHRLLHPVHSGFLNAAVCGGQMRLVRGLISFAVSLRNAFSSAVRCHHCRVTLLLIRSDSSAASPLIWFWPHRAFYFHLVLFFLFVALKDATWSWKEKPCLLEFSLSIQIAHIGKWKRKNNKALTVYCGIILPSTFPPPRKFASELLWPENPNLVTLNNFFLIVTFKTTSSHPNYKLVVRPKGLSTISQNQQLRTNQQKCCRENTMITST